jgi:hypothetical protein
MIAELDDLASLQDLMMGHPQLSPTTLPTIATLMQTVFETNQATLQLKTTTPDTDKRLLEATTTFAAKALRRLLRPRWDMLLTPTTLTSHVIIQINAILNKHLRVKGPPT